MSGPSPTDLAEMGLDAITVGDIEQVLSADRTTVSLSHNGEALLEPSSEKVNISKPRCRTHDSYDGRRTEISFKVSFVVSDDDFPDNDDSNEMRATSSDWGLTEE